MKKVKKTQYSPLPKLAMAETTKMCSEKNVPLLPSSFYLGVKWGQK
jgi:hypothetical protein